MGEVGVPFPGSGGGPNPGMLTGALQVVSVGELCWPHVPTACEGEHQFKKLDRVKCICTPFECQAFLPMCPQKGEECV